MAVINSDRYMSHVSNIISSIERLCTCMHMHELPRNELWTYYCTDHTPMCWPCQTAAARYLCNGDILISLKHRYYHIINTDMSNNSIPHFSLCLRLGGLLTHLLNARCTHLLSMHTPYYSDQSHAFRTCYRVHLSCPLGLGHGLYKVLSQQKTFYIHVCIEIFIMKNLNTSPVAIHWMYLIVQHNANIR